MKESNSWPDPHNPRHTRAFFNSKRVMANELLSQFRTAAAIEHAAQIKDARPSQGDEADNLNYDPSRYVRSTLNDVEHLAYMMGIEVGFGPKKTRNSGLDAPFPVDQIRQGDFNDPSK